MNHARPTLLLIVAALIPVVILSAVVGRYFIREQQLSLDQELRGKASVMGATLQRELDTQIKLLSLVAESPRLDPPVSGEAFGELARRLRLRIPEWDQIRVSDDSGTVVLSVPPLDGSASKRVVEMKSHDIVVNADRAVVGDIVVGPNGKGAFAVRVPIDRSDRLRAVLSAVIRPSIVSTLLYANGLPPGWMAWVIDGEGNLVASTGSPVLAGQPESGFASFSGGTFGTGTTANGTPLRVSAVPLEGTPWRIRVGLPVSEYDALSWKAAVLLSISSVFTLILSGFAVLLFYKESRARALEQEKVANWQRMDALGKLTGQVAHDFNNLLMVFQAGVEGIRRRRADEQRMNQLLEHMSEGVTRGKSMTQRLLSFSRRSNQDAQPIDLELKLADLAPLLRQAVNDAITVEIKIGQDTWPVTADPAALDTALINLVTNAREAMPNGGNVTIGIRNVQDGRKEDVRLRGEVVALTVSDNGSGMTPEHQSRIFEPFFSTKKSGAAGLGLTQVSGFAERSGGAIKAVSLDGKGSAFTLFLPRSRAVVTETVTKSTSFPNKVLIVDDTPASLESARLALEASIPVLLTATSGAEALLILEQQPDIGGVLSDVMMPGMSGLELSTAIAQRNELLPVVLMTGYSAKLEQGADAGRPVISKPFTVNEVASAFSRAGATPAKEANILPFKARGDTV